MGLDDRILSLQRAVDRLVRRLRRGGAPEPTHRRFLIVQIDGLSRAVLDQGLASGHMPFLKRLLRRHGYRVQPMTVGLPTSTPAFQMAAMYGVRPDIPGFHYYDRERQTDIHFPRRGHAALVEAKLAAGRRGILEGGSAYGCVFTGGAENNLFTFASITRPSGRGLLAALSPFVVLGWVCVKSLLRTLIELGRAVPRFLANPLRRRQSRRWFMIKIGISIWMRGFFTMAVCRDLYAGAPAVYVNYIDYDEAAHAFGPRSRPALVTLRRVDRAIRQLWRVVRRVPEHQYDLYILSDHGQTACIPYRELTGGQRFERWIFDQLLNQPTGRGASEARADYGLARGIRARRQGTAGLFQHFLNYIDEDFLRRSDPEAHQQNGIRVISAGPNAFLYILDVKEPFDADALERRFPGLAEKLSQSPGVGLVLARSNKGPVCFWHGKRYLFLESGPGPFAERADALLVIQAIADLMTMPSAGDFVIYGIGAPHGHVSFIPEMGTHAGASPEELHTFIVHPAKVTLPSSINHPVQLYDHFIRYQEPS
ncbi:MAG: alkaline phosphatase family protein [Deltaproteobacteria bacterium]|nr:alkaline phosphatase family protein [Deltaproteobacteria bacterium]